MTEFVCPKPMFWDQVYQKLKHAWEEAGSAGPPPPRPFILGGWNFSDDWTKKKRWEATLEWANEQGLEHLIPALHPDTEYRVTEIYKFKRLDPFGGYNTEPREVPSEKAVEGAVQTLTEKWSEIVGKEIAEMTTPIRISGRKKRRLIVAADETATPPWGSWITLTYSGRDQKEAFTLFRVAINKAIAPVCVDHVDFVFVSTPKLNELRRR